MPADVGELFTLTTMGSWLSPEPLASTRTRGLRWLRGVPTERVIGVVVGKALDEGTEMSYVVIPGFGSGWVPSAFFDIVSKEI